MAASVTPFRRCACATVRDEHRRARASAGSSGDVAGRDKIAMPCVPAMRTAKSATCGLWNTTLALGTGRACCAFIYAHNSQPSPLGLVSETPHQVGPSPDVQSPVLAPTGMSARDPSRVPDHQRADAARNGPSDHCLCRLVVRDTDTAPVASFSPTGRRAQLLPPPGAFIATARRLGRHDALPSLRVG
jgi:hypothetical protein